jgi:glutathione S-transferase
VEARRRAADVTQVRLPKFLGYFEQVLARNQCGSGWLVGGVLCYADLSLFQVLAGLQYAYPRVMRRLHADLPLSMALAKRVAQQPRIKTYLRSRRRLPFNQQGIFRHYPELDR